LSEREVAFFQGGKDEKGTGLIPISSWKTPAKKRGKTQPSIKKEGGGNDLATTNKRTGGIIKAGQPGHLKREKTALKNLNAGREKREKIKQPNNGEIYQKKKEGRKAGLGKSNARKTPGGKKRSLCSRGKREGEVGGGSEPSCV